MSSISRVTAVPSRCPHPPNVVPSATISLVAPPTPVSPLATCHLLVPPSPRCPESHPSVTSGSMSPCQILVPPSSVTSGPLPPPAATVSPMSPRPPSTSCHFWLRVTSWCHHLPSVPKITPVSALAPCHLLLPLSSVTSGPLPPPGATISLMSPGPPSSLCVPRCHHRGPARPPNNRLSLF